MTLPTLPRVKYRVRVVTATELYWPPARDPKKCCTITTSLPMVTDTATPDARERSRKRQCGRQPERVLRTLVGRSRFQTMASRPRYTSAAATLIPRSTPDTPNGSTKASTQTIRLKAMAMLTKLQESQRCSPWSTARSGGAATRNGSPSAPSITYVDRTWRKDASSGAPMMNPSATSAPPNRSR